jgi:DNA-binding LytR/AlgR family response regulator
MEEKRPINVLVVDDDAVAMVEAKQNIGFYVEENRIYMATNAVEMMRLLSTVPMDLAFLDMEMPDTDGFSIADYLTKVQPKTKYVFLTGHTELGAKSYEYEPIDFLCKPVNALRLQKTFERFDRLHGVTPREEQIAVETNTGYILVSPKEIRYISRDSRKTVIHCGAEEHTVKSTLTELEVIFADYDLIRCHQSFLLSLGHVTGAEKSAFGRTFSAVLDTGERVPVSREKYPQLREYLTRQGLIR